MANKLTKNKGSEPADEELEELLKRANSGDESAAKGIRKLLDRSPEVARLLGGDVAYNAEQILVRAIAGKDVARREALHRKMEQIRSELVGPNPGPLERLLVERVVLCWLHSYHADYRYGQANGVTLDYGQYLQRQQDRAQRRYLAAIKCLATVRRLALPIRFDVTVAGAAQSRPTAPTCRRVVDTVRISQEQRA